MDDATLPPRGWYPDPAGAGAWRWWDGQAWTADLHPFGPGGRIDGELLAREAALARRLLRVGLPLFLVAVVATAVADVLDAEQLAASWRWLRSVIDEALRGGSVSISTSGLPARRGLSSILSSLVATPAAVVAIVMVLMCQHAMAKTAKALGWPQRLSPTAGVVLWFVPIANLALPLVAWLDLLPARHPARRSLVATWASLIGILLAQGLAMPAAAASSLLLGLLSAAGLGLAAVVVRTAPGLVSAIEAEHAAAAGAGRHEAGGGL